MAVYGTSNKGAGRNPSVQCTLDGIALYDYVDRRFEMDTNRFPVCSDLNTSTGQPHTLEVTVSSAPATLFIDYILFRPPDRVRDKDHLSMMVLRDDSSINFLNGPWEAHEGAMVGAKTGARARVSFNGAMALLWTCSIVIDS